MKNVDSNQVTFRPLMEQNPSYALPLITFFARSRFGRRFALQQVVASPFELSSFWIGSLNPISEFVDLPNLSFARTIVHPVFPRVVEHLVLVGDYGVEMFVVEL